MFQQILDKFPIVFVGTGQAATAPDPLDLENWGARRTGLLTKRSVIEFAGPGDDGGKYLFPSGTVEQVDDNGYEFRFKINNDLTGPVPNIDAYELSRRMLARGAVESSEYNVSFARVVDSIEIESPESVLIKLKVPYICLLYTSPSPRDATLSRMPSSA